MSVPSTLQGTHDECGGTVVFRPATQRRALLAGHRVELHAACRTCGETLSIEWELEEWNEPLVQLDERRAAHAARQTEPVPVTMPMASGGEHWAAAHAAVETEAPQVTRAAEPTWQEWEPTPRSSANRVATSPVESPRPESMHHDAPVEHGNIDEFLGRFANRVAQARDNLERMRVELPSAITDEGLRRPALRRAPEAPVESMEPVSEPIARPTFGAPEPVAPAVLEPVAPVAIEPVPVVAVEPEPQVEPEPVALVTQPEVEVQPEPVAVVEVAPVEAQVPAPYELPSMSLAAPDDVSVAAVVEPSSQLPLHERIVVAATDAEVFGTPIATAAESDVALDVWGSPAVDETEPEATPEPAATAAAFVETTPDLADVVETPAVDDAALTFADLVEAEQSDERGFDWNSDDEDAVPRRRRTRTKRAKRERRPKAKQRPRTAAPADPSAELLAAVATVPAAGPSELRVRMGLSQVAIVVLLAAVAGIAFMKLVATPEIVPPASTRVTDVPTGSATTPDTAAPAPEVKQPAATTTAKSKAAPKAATKLPKAPAAQAQLVKPKATVTPGSTVAGAPRASTATAPASAPQVPATPADTAPEATNPASPSSNPFAPA